MRGRIEAQLNLCDREYREMDLLHAIETWALQVSLVYLSGGIFYASCSFAFGFPMWSYVGVSYCLVCVLFVRGLFHSISERRRECSFNWIGEECSIGP